MTNHTTATDPDVTMFHLVHRGMRQDSQRLAALVETFDRTSTREAAAALRWLRGFRGELHEHHSVEDTIFYPALVARVPTVAAPLERVEADHQTLDARLDELDGLLQTIASGHATPTTAPDAARSAHDLAEFLTAHLDLEDADLVPLFVRHFSAAEYDALTAKAMKAGRLRDLVFAVPWIIDHATPQERDQLLADAPLPLRLLWRGTRRRYAHIVAGAFGDRPVPVAVPAPAAAPAARS